MFEYRVRHPESATSVVIRPRVIDDIGALLSGGFDASGRQRTAALITDDVVGPLYAERVRASMTSAGFRVEEHRVPSGEDAKSLEVVSDLYATFAAARLDRHGVVLALGGGVVSDVAGLVAASWMRGVSWVVLPTTMEADLDACLGGKTAINLPAGKNLVGAFHQPRLIAVDPTCLQTLSPRDVRAGLAEGVKHALLSSPELLAWCEDHAAEVLRLDSTATAELIERNLRIKADIVARDPFERLSERIVLNLGHTFGHAIEVCSGYALRHGECVAMGLIAACRLSRTLTGLPSEVVDRVECLLAALGLPTRLSVAVESDAVIEAMRDDKKMCGGRPTLVLLEDIGRVTLRGDVEESAIRAALDSLRDAGVHAPIGQ
ncbi:MAG: 3-dehydroquinate synthase [Planctomycetes bacterium]|nr:3-dehydroquinate synthase [Planctomycetota bacterium]